MRILLSNNHLSFGREELYIVEEYHYIDWPLELYTEDLNLRNDHIDGLSKKKQNMSN